MFKAEAGSALGDARDKLGLDEKSTTSDISHIDSVLQRLEHFRTRIGAKGITEDERQGWIDAAKRFALETDAKGNEKLQEVLNSAFGTFSNTEADKIGDEVTFDPIIEKLKNASKKAAEETATEATEEATVEETVEETTEDVQETVENTEE